MHVSFNFKLIWYANLSHNNGDRPGGAERRGPVIVNKLNVLLLKLLKVSFFCLGDLHHAREPPSHTLPPFL